MGWEPSGVYSASSVYGALALNVFVAFTVSGLFLECFGWMFMKFTAFVAFMRHLGRSFCGIQSVCSVYGALGLDLCGVYRVGSVYGVLGWTFGALALYIWHLGLG